MEDPLAERSDEDEEEGEDGQVRAVQLSPLLRSARSPETRAGCAHVARGQALAGSVSRGPASAVLTELAALQRPSSGTGGLQAAQRQSTRRKPHVDLARLDVRGALVLLCARRYTAETDVPRRDPLLSRAAGADAAQVPARVQARRPAGAGDQGRAAARGPAPLAESGECACSPRLPRPACARADPVRRADCRRGRDCAGVCLRPAKAGDVGRCLAWWHCEDVQACRQACS